MSSNHKKIAHGIDWIRHDFTLTPENFKAIVYGFKAECEKGLSTPTATGLATMIPSYVTRMPTGKETGTYLALDLGGSTLRVCAVCLLGEGQVKVTEVRKTISDQLRTSTTAIFFDWIADTVAELLGKIPSSQQRADKPAVAMGVSWSFPLDQTGISKGKILRMGKGFVLSDIEGNDLATLFHQGFQRKGLNVIVTALVNDTIGALVAHAYSNPQARVGFIYGTGVNAAYPEKVSRMIKLNVAEWRDTTTEMLVNTELDIFGSDGEYLPRTRFDHALDASHAQPGFQPYEKMMSGAYLGELVRLVVVDLVTHHGLFGGVAPSLLQTPWQFLTLHMSEIEAINDDTGRLIEYFANLFHFTPNEQDALLFKSVCEMVSTRAAGLAAAGIAAMIEQQSFTPEQDIVIGINGTTFERYPRMPERMHSFLSDWFGDDISSRIKLQVARDGGSIGAALVAMLYSPSSLSRSSPETKAKTLSSSTSSTPDDKSTTAITTDTITNKHNNNNSDTKTSSIKSWFLQYVLCCLPTRKTESMSSLPIEK
ncbi:probable glucokinase [Lichtheimia corymbifera JMRC:FSU:9682]|uniref:Phosphotransferase n=1 Tax=Lichtheimia corymbifera JMRC:FSU:9682 TaxID=1263082 RepID=A0A068RWJ5_9FUNG|nr:probable glucokinase [Lichtheimia corymbifera JMRC:FSU:9682]